MLYRDQSARHPDLVEVLPRFPLEARSVYAAYPSRKHSPRTVLALVDFLTAQLD